MKRMMIAALLLAGATFMIYRLLVQKPQVDGQEKERVPFAVDRVPGGQTGNVPASAMAQPLPFDGDRAMGYLKAICAIGPRISGSEGMKKQQEKIIKHFEDLKLNVQVQKFKARQRSKPGEVDMANLIVSIHPEKIRRVILCTHYDTRPLADQEANKLLWNQPFLSANDGGSGVAWLMEMAHSLKDTPLAVGVDLVFFDGEEYVFTQGDQYFLGSRHFAQSWLTNRNKDRPQYLAGILLDMIAGKNPSFPVEGHSRDQAPLLCQEIWTLARELNCTAFKQRLGEYVQDDHTELQKVRIPAIDIIDFSYPHWHKLSDTPENCSPDGMRQVAKVLSVWLQNLR